MLAVIMVFLSTIGSIADAQSCSAPLANIPVFQDQEDTEQNDRIPLPDDRLQVIIPAYTFTCHGRVVQWGACVERGGRRERYDIDFQVLRPSPVSDPDVDCYSLVGSNFLQRGRPSGHCIVYDVPEEEQVLVQPGDVVGFFSDHVRDDDDDSVQVVESREDVTVYYKVRDDIPATSPGSCMFVVGPDQIDSMTTAAPVITAVVDATPIARAFCSPPVANIPVFQDQEDTEQNDRIPLPFDRLQVIIPAYTFTCHGRVVQWGACVERGGGGERYNIDFQVLRPSPISDPDVDCYSLVGSNFLQMGWPSGHCIVYDVPEEEQVLVQPGDVVGFFSDNVNRIGNNGVQVVENREDVAVHYRIRDFIPATEPGSCMFVVGPDQIDSTTLGAPVITAIVELVPITSPVVFPPAASLPFTSLIRSTIPAVVVSSTPPAVVTSPTPPVIVASPTPPVVVTSPTPPVVVASPTPPVIVASPTPPVVVTSPTPPVVVASPTPPVVVTSPTPPVVVASPTPPVVVTSPTPPVVVTSPTPPAAVTSPTPPVEVTSLTPPVVVTSPTPPAAVTSPTPPVEVTSPTPPVEVTSPTPPAAVTSTTLSAVDPSVVPTDDVLPAPPAVVTSQALPSVVSSQAPPGVVSSPTSPVIGGTSVPVVQGPSPTASQPPTLPNFGSSEAPSSGGGGVSTMAIIGIVIGLLLAVIIVVVVFVILFALSRSSRQTFSSQFQNGIVNPNYERGLAKVKRKSKRISSSSTNYYQSIRNSILGSTQPQDYTYPLSPKYSVPSDSAYTYISTGLEMSTTHHYECADLRQGRPDEATAEFYLIQDTCPSEYEDSTTMPFYRTGDPGTFDSAGIYVPTEEQRIAAGNHYDILENNEYNKLKFFVEDQTYWAPASSTSGLYAQLAAKKYREIPRHQIVLGDNLGSGQFGKVCKGQWRFSGASLEIAVKTLKTDSSESGKVRFLQEAAIMGQFRHTNIVRLYGVVTIGDPTMIVLELMPNGDLRGYLKKLKWEDESEVQSRFLRFAREIAAGMAYLSGKSFVHRDLAARNILLDQELKCKIGDFGLARDLVNDTYYQSRGGQIPVKWTAPEALFYKKYSVSSDVWSYAMVLFEIWSVGCKPFQNLSNADVIALVHTGYCQPPAPGCPREIYRLMVDCWNPAHLERPTFVRIRDYLSQPDRQLLAWEEDVSSSRKARELGAPISESKHLYLDLQHKYKL